MEGQQRATKTDFHNHLKELRDERKTQPMTKEWIKRPPQLSRKDILGKEGWDFVPIATTGNLERLHILKFQTEQWGKQKNEPIIR